MKSFVVILLLANIGFFLWAKQYPTAMQLPMPEAKAEQQIKLLSEEPNLEVADNATELDDELENPEFEQPDEIVEESSGPSEEPVEELQASLINDRCFSVGVFETEEIVESLEENLANASINAEVNSVDLREPKSYWIYLPPLESYAQARQVSRSLRSKRIKDYFIVRDKNEWENAISLGLYSKLDQVDRRVAQLNRKDIEPEVETRYRDYKEYRVVYVLGPGQEDPEFLVDLLESDAELEKQAAECEDV